MKTKGLLTITMLLFATLMIFTTGCKEDPPPVETDYFDVMTTYMVDNGMDLSDMTSEWIISATDVDANGIANYYIIDLRATDAFATGHIEGAHNTTLGNILTEAANADKPILIVCYTGQSAAHGLVALRLSGYADCKTLMFGMSSWSGDFDSWTANTANIADGNTNWSTTNTIETPITFTDPTFTVTPTTGAEILEARVALMLSEGFKGVTSADVLATPTNYFINNYWLDVDVDMYGHIVGAYRVKEDLTLANDGFKHLDSALPVVTYCWTGQTSSLVTAYLNVLGYNALSLKFGANSMIYTQLQAHKWVASGDFPYITD